MTTIFTTLNSTYELDDTHGRIRRIEGVNPPTAHFSPNGEWKPYVAIQDWNGTKIVFWGEGKATTLSTITEMTDT